MKLKTPTRDEIVLSVEKHGIMPTHKCFDDALDLLASIAKEELGALLTPGMESDFNYRLCHAICESDTGKKYAHAFVEDIAKGLVRSIGKLPEHDGLVEYAADKSEYYDRFKVLKVWQYDLLQAFILNRKFMNYGPWEVELLKLCADYKPGLEQTRLVK